MVIIKEDSVKPMHWKRGRIIEFITGRDNVIRGVKLQSTSPTGRIIHIKRSVQKIIPLEIAPTNNKGNASSDSNNITEEDMPVLKKISENSNNSLEDREMTDIPKNNSRMDSKSSDCEINRTLEHSDIRSKSIRPRRNAAISGKIKRRFDSIG